MAIAGAAGRMGRNLVGACHEEEGREVTQAVARPQSDAVGGEPQERERAI